MVTGKTKQAEIDRILHEYEHGEVRALVNVACLNVGFNVPSIDLLFNMRPMRSPVMYIQSTGRAMRLCEGKRDALFLDFGGVIETLGPIDQVHVATKIKGDGEAPVKYCPECNAECHAAVRNCPDCNYEFPEPELKIDKKASNAAILSTQIKPETYPVTHVMYFAHNKEGKPVTLRVEYLSGALFSFREWICLEHNGYAREKACKWWRGRADTQPPNKVSEALERKAEMRRPTEIEVRKVGKYWDIIGYKF
jgi:DNA repair protein RadD